MLMQVLWKGSANLFRYWKVILLIQLVSLLAAAFPAFLVGDEIRSSLERSAVAEQLRSGFDDLWYRHFKQQATGLPATFDPAESGAGAILGPFDDLLTGKLLSQKSGILLVGLAYFIAWTFLTGGLFSLLWTRRMLVWPDLLADGLRFFGRLLGIGLLGLLGYWILLGGLHGWLKDWIAEVTRNWIDERRMFQVTLLKYGFLWILLGCWMAWLDAARAVVIGDDASLLESLKRGAAFLSRNGLGVAGLYLPLMLFLAVFVAVYVGVAPGVGQAGFFSLLGALVFSQLLFFVRLFIRLQRPAVMLELYRGRRR